MGLLPKTSRAQWLGQFALADQDMAKQALAAIKSVNSADFEKAIYYRFLSHFKKFFGTIAVYPEREIRKYKKRPVRFFREDKIRKGKKIRLRASGGAPSPYYSMRGDRIDIGSEGHVASIVGQLARAENTNIFASPSPNLIRKKKIRHIAIVTDFIGSGDRIASMLDSFWRVRSIRSWHSYRWVKFHVIAYSGTESGVAHIEGHPSMPVVTLAAKARTIESCFARHADAQVVRDLCLRYNPDNKEYGLGYGDAEILTVFSHGCPNNVPAIFWSDKKGWIPIFKSRTTFASPLSGTQNDPVQAVIKYFTVLGYVNLVGSQTFSALPLQTKQLILVLAAIKKSARSIDEISERTGLDVSYVFELMAVARKNNLATSGGYLTDVGEKTLKSAISVEPKPKRIDSKAGVHYYPKQLRAPIQRI